jgi:predicted nucleic acid-binding protein
MALISGREVCVDSRAVVGVAIDLDLSTYDAQYVAAALALKSVLVTEDRRALARAPAVARSLEDWVRP